LLVLSALRGYCIVLFNGPLCPILIKLMTMMIININMTVFFTATLSLSRLLDCRSDFMFCVMFLCSNGLCYNVLFVF